MNRIKVLLLWQMLLLQSLVSVALAQTTLVVGTYNIRGPNGNDTGERDWNQRKAAVVQTIQDNNYDIIGLNECHGGAIIGYLEEQLGDYAFVKYSDLKSPGTTTENFNPVLYLREKFDLLDSGVFYLATDMTRPTISWDNNTNNYRFTVWAKLRVKATDEVIFFFETHLDHQGDDARNEQARINMEQIRLMTGACPVVLAGDHNSSKVRIPFYNLMGSYMLDARTAAKTTEGIENGDGTMSKHTVDSRDFWDPDYHKSSRIDWIWTRGVTVDKYKTINATYGRTQTPSDHFAIQATITLNEYNPTRVFTLPVTGNINDVIAQAGAGDTILVEAGRLSVPGTGKTATVKVNKSLTIIGGYNSDFTRVTGLTELSGDTKGDDVYDNFSIANTTDNISHLITVTQGCALELANFDLHGGNAPQGGSTAQGGAIYCQGNLVHLTNCTVHDNVAYSNGAGVYCAGQINAANCRFYNNVSLYGSGGALYSPTNNSELFWRYSIRNSVFNGNKAAMGAACFTGAFSQLHVSGCTFYGNRATNAGTYYASRTASTGKVCFVNNTFTDNEMNATVAAGLPGIETRGGSAILLTLSGEASTVALVNNTIVGNSASCLSDGSVPDAFCGAAVQVTTDATVRLYNNIIAGNVSNASTGGDIYLTNLVHVDTQRNVYSSAANCHINFSDNDYHMSDLTNAVNALGTMLNGEVKDGKFHATLTQEGNTPVVAVKSLAYGTKYINDVPADNYSESRFYGDVDGDADYTSVLTTDQRGCERNMSGLSVRGAYEYGAVSAIDLPDGTMRRTDGGYTLYNIYGVRVNDGYKGIVICNGKKYLKH